MLIYSDEGTKSYWQCELYTRDMWQKTTQASLVLKNTTNYRVCPTFRKTRAIEMRIAIAVSLAIQTWITQLFFRYFKK